MSVRKFADPGVGECPICMEHVGSLKLLPCSHSLCAACLVRLQESGTPFPCPNCRKSIAPGRNEILTTFCGRIECSSCLRMKEAEEFYWCTECASILCCRCLTKDHGFRHTLHEWGTRAAYQACFQNVSVDSQDSATLERKYMELFRPVAKLMASTVPKDNLSRAKEAFGMDEVPTGGQPKNPEQVLRFLSALSGIDLNPNAEKGHPSGWKDPGEVAELLKAHLTFSDIAEETSAEKWTQTEANAKQKLTQTEENIPSSLLRSLSMLSVASSASSSKTMSAVESPRIVTKLSCSFKKTHNDIVAVGAGGVLLCNSMNCVVLVGGTHYSHSTNDPDVCYKDAAIDAQNHVHSIMRRTSPQHEIWHYSYWDLIKGDHYDLNIPSLPTGEEQLRMMICCSHTGVPFIVARTQQFSRRNNRIAVLRCAAGPSPTYDTVEFVHNIKDTIIVSCQAVRKARNVTWLLAADLKRVYVCLKKQGGAFTLHRTVEIPFNFTLAPNGTFEGLFGLHKTDVDLRKITVAFYSLESSDSKTIKEVEAIASLPTKSVGFQNDKLCSVAYDSQQKIYVLETHNIKVSRIV